MRFLIKRPKSAPRAEDFDAVLSVMQSELFICLDIVVFSMLLTILLQPVFNSFILQSTAFVCSCLFFGGVYYFLFHKTEKTPFS